METKYYYKCTNTDCNNFYDKVLFVIGEDEEKECPKCHSQEIALASELEVKHYLKDPDAEIVDPIFDKPKRKLWLPIGIGVSLVALALILILILPDKKTPVVEPDPEAQTTHVETSVEEAQPSEEMVTEDPGQGSGTYNSGENTISFANGNKYMGDIKNGVPDGVGTYYFKVREIISKRDPQNRVGEPGDVLQGLWKEGYFVNGKLFDKQGTLKEVLILGTN